MSLGSFLDCEMFLAGGSARLSAEGQDLEGEVRLGDELAAKLLAAESKEDPILYGQRLFEALFANERLRAGYGEFLGRARHTDQRLRLRLYIAAKGNAPEVHGLHWEYLYDPWHRFPLGCSSETAFSRYLSVDLEPPSPVSGVLRLLVVLSAPQGLEGTTLEPLDRDELKRSIEKSLEPLEGAVDYRFLEPPATLSRIREHLVSFEAHTLVFTGHGLLRQGEAAGLVLEDDDGGLAICDEAGLAGILRDLRELRLVVLLACHSGVPATADPYSGLGPALLRCGVPAVVAMRREVSLESATLFIRHFFLNLGRTERVDAAVNEARMQLFTHNRMSWDWGVPILFMRLRDARLWQDLPATGSPIRPPPKLDYDELWWRPILDRLRKHAVIPILGPGLVHGLLPSKEEIAATLAEEWNFPWNGADRRNLPHVAQFVKTQSDDKYPSVRYREILTHKLLERQQVHGPVRLEDPDLSEVIEQIAEGLFAGDPEEPHHVLAGLPIANYLTTNIDNFMTAALRRVGNRNPKRRHCLWHELTDAHELQADDYRQLLGDIPNPLVFHLFGHDQADPMYQVLTEDDHLDFLRMIAEDFHHYRLTMLLREALNDSILVFLGYKIEDLDCRVLFRGLIKEAVGERNSGNVTVWQFPESDRSRERQIRTYVEKSCAGAEKVYFGSIRQFLTELRDRWEESHDRG